IDNSVDEALAGHCNEITVTAFKDGSLSVEDNGRGMPVDIHPIEKVSGVELILTRLHAGGKFSDQNYAFSGGLHGVGVSVVNALSKELECRVRRGGKEFSIGFRNGNLSSKLKEVGTVGKNNTGTTVHFWPDGKFFDTDKFLLSDLRHTLKAKAVLCPGLRMRFVNEATGEKDEWFYTGALSEYLIETLGNVDRSPKDPLAGKTGSAAETIEWALAWAPDLPQAISESYVNLIPTAGGGTHVNGLRAGVCAAIREFTEFRNLLPRGVKLTPEDIWSGVSFVLSLKMKDPQFAGQTKERLGSREAAAMVEGYVHDATAMWLNQHPEAGEGIAMQAIANAQERIKAALK
ncbi:MAG: DNA topoisomerase IV subunit B, partial [Proteobacteria bacterium]